MANEAKEEVKIEIPEVPGFADLPQGVKNQWRANYAKAFKQAAIDHPGDDIQQRQEALREANRIFRVDEPADYAAAMKLADWQVLFRETKNGTLRVVTIDGKKFSFETPSGGRAGVKA